MDYFELVEISTRSLELTSPASSDKLSLIGQYLDLNKDKLVIDFGCGYGRALELWGKDFNISGIGIDIHDFMCQKTKNRIARSGLSSQIEVVCSSALEYPFRKNSYDVASCLGASFIWGGYRKAIEIMKESLKPGGKLVVGEPYYKEESVPQELINFEGDLYTEYQIIQIAREEGFDVEFVVRANQDDWDRYESSKWYGLLRWIDKNPVHPERKYVREYLNKKQDIYFRYQRKLEGWAIYILKLSQ